MRGLVAVCLIQYAFALFMGLFPALAFGIELADGSFFSGQYAVVPGSRCGSSVHAMPAINVLVTPTSLTIRYETYSGFKDGTWAAYNGIGPSRNQYGGYYYQGFQIHGNRLTADTYDTFHNSRSSGRFQIERVVLEKSGASLRLKRTRREGSKDRQEIIWDCRLRQVAE
jgi:hypothetical protein